MEDNGWIKLYRCLMDKAIWISSTPEHKVILITILMMANHKEKEWEWKGNKFKAEPGQFVTSANSIVLKCGKGITRQNVRSALDKFERYEFLTIETTKTGMLISIVNWHDYQASKEDGNQDINNQITNNQPTGNQEITNNQPTGNQEVTTNKNDNNDNTDNNDKNDKNINSSAAGEASDSKKRIDYNAIMKEYHSVCKSYPTIKSITESRKRAINARLGTYTVNDMFTVFQKAEESDFLKGKNDRNWKADFDWMMKDANFTKILEGKYNAEKKEVNANQNNPQKNDKFSCFPADVRERLEKEGVITGIDIKRIGLTEWQEDQLIKYHFLPPKGTYSAFVKREGMY